MRRRVQVSGGAPRRGPAGESAFSLTAHDGGCGRRRPRARGACRRRDPIVVAAAKITMTQPRPPQRPAEQLADLAMQQIALTRPRDPAEGLASDPMLTTTSSFAAPDRRSVQPCRMCGACAHPRTRNRPGRAQCLNLGQQVSRRPAGESPPPAGWSQAPERSQNTGFTRHHARTRRAAWNGDARPRGRRHRRVRLQIAASGGKIPRLAQFVLDDWPPPTGDSRGPRKT